MTDYQPLLARALKGLERNTSEARRSVYDRARQALLNQLRSATPPMADADITRERLALEDAIRKTETEAVLAEPHTVRATPAARMPLSSRFATPPSAAPVRPAPPAPAPKPAEIASEPEVVEPEASAPEAEAPIPEESPPPPSPPSSPGLTLPPSLLSTPAPRGAPVSKEAPSATRSGARPPLPPRGRPPMPANGASPERGPHPQGSRSRNGNARRDALDELSQEFELQRPASARRAERPRQPVHDGPVREARGENPAPPSPPPGRPRMPRAAVPGPGMPPPSAKSRPAAGGNRTKILIAGAAVLLIAVGGVLAYTLRGRIADTAAPQTPAADADQPKSSERVAQSPGGERRSEPTNLDPAVAQRAVLYEENPGGGQQFQNFVGSAVWKTEAVTGSGRAPELGLKIEIEIPDRHISVVLKMRKNNDPSFPASHTIEVLFTIPAGDAFGGVTDMRGIRAKAGETAQGTPIAAEVQKVKEGYFLLALPVIEENTNLAMLRDRDWIDIPFVYANGRRAVLTFQKGTPGERAVREVFMSWGQGGGG
jgi:hypothetical protein